MGATMSQAPRMALALGVWLVLSMIDACLVAWLTDIHPRDAAVIVGSVWLVVVAAVDPAAVDHTGMVGQLATRLIAYPALVLLGVTADRVFG